MMNSGHIGSIKPHGREYNDWMVYILDLKRIRNKKERKLKKKKMMMMLTMMKMKKGWKEVKSPH